MFKSACFLHPQVGGAGRGLDIFNSACLCFILHVIYLVFFHSSIKILFTACEYTYLVHWYTMSFRNAALGFCPRYYIMP